MVLENYITNPYVRSIVLALGIIIIIRIVISLAFGVAKSFTKRTKTDLDDLIMNKAATPLTIIIFLFAIEIPLRELPLSESIELIVSKIIFSIAITIVAYMIYVLFDLIILNAWKEFSRRTKT